ncbi:Uncharacterised protein [Shigella sonnei]|nr:Uncharacterised protein [Shigella sonnei]
MQLVARPAPIILVKVWDGDRQFVPMREQLPVLLLFVQQSVHVPFQQGTHHMEEKASHWCAGIN